MKKIISMVFHALLILTTTQIMAQMDSASPINNVSADAAQTYLKSGNYTILDIRTPMEYNSGRIEGAINIDFYQRSFMDDLSKLDKDQPYFVYCRSGNRTGQSMKIFQSLGFKEIVHLERGIVDWLASGYKLVQ